MNDFSELEAELKKLRPLPPSAELFSRIEKGIGAGVPGERAAGNIIRPARFQLNWLSFGVALGAAAVLLIVAHIDLKRPAGNISPVANHAPGPTNPSASVTNEFIPAGATQVVYRTQDDGLVFPSGATEPVRRLRSRTRETWQWNNPATGASLRVSYPSEQVELIPVSGQ